MKSKKVSGSGLKDVEEAENSVKEYSFLSWLDSYIKPRKTFSNFEDTELEVDIENRIDFDDV